MENLEHTKKTAAEIELKVIESKKTSSEIDKVITTNISFEKPVQVREFYRGSAARASLLYFILNDLNKINPMYQFSLKAFSVVFDVAIKVSKDCLCKPTFFISASGQGQGRCKKSSELDRLNHVHGVPIHGQRLVRM